MLFQIFLQKPCYIFFRFLLPLIRYFPCFRLHLEYFSFKDGRTDDKNPTTMAEKRYATISLMANELGKFIGSWIKKVKEENKW